MKPDWDKAPAWANWFAFDKDGTCYWMEGRPDNPQEHDEYWGTGGERWEIAVCTYPTWDKSLEARPDGHR